MTSHRMKKWFKDRQEHKVGLGRWFAYAMNHCSVVNNKAGNHFDFSEFTMHSTAVIPNINLNCSEIRESAGLELDITSAIKILSRLRLMPMNDCSLVLQ
jgi:hypothetical protein